MNHKHKAISILGTGLAILAVGIAASGRPAAAQAPLLAQTHPIMGWFSGHHDTDQDQGRNHNSDRNHDRDHWRAEQARRDEVRARHEAEKRHERWLRDHRGDRDHDQRRDDHNRDRHGDNH